MSAIDPAWLKAHPEAITQARRASPFKAYAATPGTGPAGETCRSCLHYTHAANSEGRGKKWPKCGLMRALWTHGPGTDIRARSPACEKWEERGKGENRLVTVCDHCLQASCWQGLFMCQQSREAGIVYKTVAELRKLGLENPCYWKL